MDSVLELGMEVIMRPHPHSWEVDKEVLEYIEEKYGHRIMIDRSMDNVETLKKADVLISDTISGILYDFVFIFQKPVIAITREDVMYGYELKDLSTKNAASILAEEAGALVPIEEIEDIEKIVKRVKNKNIEKAIIDAHIFNYGKAGKIAAGQIIEICEGNSI